MVSLGQMFPKCPTFPTFLVQKKWDSLGSRTIYKKVIFFDLFYLKRSQPGLKVRIKNIVEGDFTTVVLHVTGFDDQFLNLDSDWSDEIAALHVEDGHRSYTTLKTRPLKRNFKIILSNQNCRKWKESYEANHFTGFMIG